ncbi:MAG: hypothetical protein R2754_03010 [Microthrixaceae bacterium]
MTAARSAVNAPGSATPTGGPAGLSLWGVGRRLLPVATYAAWGVICGAWAVASGLDAPIETTVLAILASVVLSVVFVDAAAAVTAPSVLTLMRRRFVAALLGTGLATTTWLAARCLAAAFGGGPWPGRWALLEWSTIALSQLAVGALASTRRPDSTSFGPGVVLGLVWYLVVAMPRSHEALFDPQDHPLEWSVMLATALLIAMLASRDPMHRLPRRSR